MLRPVTAVYDANVLYPAPLRDFLVRIAQTGLVQARWTDRIHEEWIRNLLRVNPRLSADRLDRTRKLLNGAIRDSMVTGFENLIEGLSLPDDDDRHVLAAAIHAKAQFIVTFNLRDFPPSSLQDFDITAIHPDEFIRCLVNLDIGAVLLALRLQSESLKNPPISMPELLEILERQGLKESVLLLKQSI